MNKTLILKDLATFISIPSVSSESSRYEEILKAVQFLKEKLERLNFKIKIIKKDRRIPPLLVALSTVPHAKKTIGIYGHYDVQFEEPVSEWKSHPFELTIKDGKMFGRGVADNKGHIIQNLAAIESLIIEKKLQHNIAFVIEGEEEEGSKHFEEFTHEVQDILSHIDMYYVTDVGMHTKNVPQILYALRGLVYFELTVITADRDLHSGIYGNQVLNPVQAICDLMGKMKSLRTNKVLIPHFYQKVRSPSKKELELLQSVKVTDAELKKEAGVQHVFGFNNVPAYLAPKLYPSCDINGMLSGYTGEGSKTIIPKSAMIKFSMRLVEHQDPDQIEKLVQTFIKSHLPKGITYTLKILNKAAPFYTDIDNEYVKKTAGILKEIFGKEVLYNRSGGSIPAAEVLQRLFKKPIILTGFTLPDDNIHSPNENMDEEMFWQGIQALKRIYKEV